MDLIRRFCFLCVCFLGLLHPSISQENPPEQETTAEATTEMTTEDMTTMEMRTTTTVFLPPVDYLLSLSKEEIFGVVTRGLCFNNMIGTYSYAWYTVKGFSWVVCFCFNLKEDCDEEFDIYEELEEENREARAGQPTIVWEVDTILSTIVYSIVALIGVPGNILVIVTIVAVLKLNSVTNLYVFNLAIADLLVCSFCLPIRMYNTMLRRFEAPMAVCKAVQYIYFALFAVSIVTMVFMAFERYIVIVLPMKAKTWTTMTRARISVMLTWPLAFALTWPVVLQATVGRASGKCGLDKFKSQGIEFGYELSIYLLTVLYIIPCILIGVCYIHVGVVLYKSIKTSQALTGGDGGKGEEKSTDAKARLAVVKMLILVWVVFLICWGPQLITEVIWRSGVVFQMTFNQQRAMHEVSFKALSMANSCLNPILYFAMSRQFREGFIQVLTCNQIKPKKATSFASSSGGATRPTSASTAVTTVSSTTVKE